MAHYANEPSAHQHDISNNTDVSLVIIFWLIVVLAANWQLIETHRSHPSKWSKVNPQKTL